jgi:hypothetical protein
MWWRLCVGNQDWERLKEVQLTIVDRSRRILVATRLELNTSYDDGERQLCGIAGWYSDVTQSLLDASRHGMAAAIDAPRCENTEFAIHRRNIESAYDPPYFQLGGHDTGYHSAAMHYRFSYDLGLDCEFEPPDEGAPR